MTSKVLLSIPRPPAERAIAPRSVPTSETVTGAAVVGDPPSVGAMKYASTGCPIDLSIPEIGAADEVDAPMRLPSNAKEIIALLLLNVNLFIFLHFE